MIACDWFRRNALAVTLITACALTCVAGIRMPIFYGCPMQNRVAYMLCHVNVWHMLANVWCVVCIRRSNFRDTNDLWLLAILIACLVPATDAPTMGLSGMLYAMMGILSWQAINRMRYHAINLTVILLMLILPIPVNNIIHIYCYTAGVITELIVHSDRYDIEYT